MTIDWSKAPEDATHLSLPNSPNQRPVFWRVTEGKAVEAWAMEPDLSAVGDHFQYGPEGCMSFIAYSAITKPKPWDGEGLPPVGKDVCEYRGAHQWDVWTVVNIFAEWGEGSRRVVFVDFGDGWREERDAERFRPIRTAEQIAADERERGIEEIRKVLISSAKGSIESTIYDAGYRKQVAP